VRDLGMSFKIIPACFEPDAAERLAYRCGLDLVQKLFF